MIPEKQIKAILDRTEEVIRNMKYTNGFEIVIKASVTEMTTMNYKVDEAIVPQIDHIGETTEMVKSKDCKECFGATFGDCENCDEGVW